MNLLVQPADFPKEPVKDRDFQLTEFASGDGYGPLFVRNTRNNFDLFEDLERYRDEWDSLLQKRGALVFKGFNINSISAVENFARVTLRDIYKNNAEHRVVNKSGVVHVPVDYSKYEKLLWHNENTFNYSWPGRGIFACAIPAVKGGQTPFVDSRKVFRGLTDEIRAPFFEKGLMYVRRYGVDDNVGLSWSKIFNTDDKSIVERLCRETRLAFEWVNDEELVTRAVRPAVWAHPVTKELSWINQAQHWHFSCHQKQRQEELAALYKEENYPRNCYYGDGSPIDPAVMAQILSTYQEHEIVFQWERGDVVLFDNILMAHGRNPYDGDRKIFVCFGNISSFDT